MPFQHPNVEKKELVIRLLLDLADRIQWLSDGHAPAIISPPSVIVLPKTINVQAIVNTPVRHTSFPHPAIHLYFNLKHHP